MKIGQLGANEATTDLIQMHFGITYGFCFAGGGGGGGWPLIRQAPPLPYSTISRHVGRPY